MRGSLKSNGMINLDYEITGRNPDLLKFDRTSLNKLNILIRRFLFAFNYFSTPIYFAKNGKSIYRKIFCKDAIN